MLWFYILYTCSNFFHSFMEKKSQSIFMLFMVFLSWMLIFMLEVLGSRILGMFLGSSLYVWTSLIAVVLLFVSVWSILGGRYADKHTYEKTLATVLIWLSISLVFILCSDRYVAMYMIEFISDVRLSTFLVSCIIFGPATFFLGAIFPIIAKKWITNLDDDGTFLWKLWMWSTYGWIVGIVGSIFLFIPLLWIDGTLLCSIIGVSSIYLLRSFSLKKISVLCLVYVLLGSVLYAEHLDFKKKGIHSFDTLYSRINVVDSHIFGDFYRMFIVDTRILSEYNLRTKDLTPYVEENFYIFTSYLEKFQDVLMLGGAWYTFPTEFVSVYPDVNIDVVELDAWMEEIAQKYFFLKDHPNLNIIHTDARYYLNTSPKKYDVILGDAYAWLRSVPFQLATREAIQKKYDVLHENGIVVENIISSLEGDTSAYLKSQYMMFREIFDEVHLYTIRKDYRDSDVQNMFLVAVKWNVSEIQSNELTAKILSKKVDISPDMMAGGIYLVDDYAPVEQMVAPMNTKIRKNIINSSMQ